MRVGLTYDLRDDYRALGFTEEDTAEFDFAATIEANAQGDNYPAFYIRRADRVTEHLLEPDQSMQYDTPDRRTALASALGEVLGVRVAA